MTINFRLCLHIKKEQFDNSKDTIQEGLDFELRELKLVPFRGSLDKAVENFLSHMWVGDDENDLDTHCLICGTNVTTLRRLYPCCFEESKGYEYFSIESFDKISSNKEKLKNLKEKIDRENINILYQNKQEVLESLRPLFTNREHKNMKAIKKLEEMNYVHAVQKTSIKNAMVFRSSSLRE